MVPRRALTEMIPSHVTSDVIRACRSRARSRHTITEMFEKSVDNRASAQADCKTGSKLCSNATRLRQCMTDSVPTATVSGDRRAIEPKYISYGLSFPLSPDMCISHALWDLWWGSVSSGHSIVTTSFRSHDVKFSHAENTEIG